MRRREFMTLLSGSAMVWSLVARAQQADGVRRIGMLESLQADDKEAQARISAFVKWAEGIGLERRPQRSD